MRQCGVQVAPLSHDKSDDGHDGMFGMVGEGAGEENAGSHRSSGCVEVVQAFVTRPVTGSKSGTVLLGGNMAIT